MSAARTITLDQAAKIVTGTEGAGNGRETLMRLFRRSDLFARSERTTVE